MIQIKNINRITLFSVLALFSQVSDASGSASISYIDNVGFAAKDREEISDLAVTVSLEDQFTKQIGMLDKLTLSGGLEIKAYDDYIYNRATLSAGVSYQKKLGIGFHQPRLTLDWTASRHVYEYSEDNGVTSNLSLSWSKPISERIDAKVQISNRWEIPDQATSNDIAPIAIRNRNSNTLDTETRSIKVSAEYFVNESWSLPFALEYISGDLISVSNANPGLAKDSGAISWVPRIASNWYRYRFEGDATTGSFNVSKSLDSETILNFGYQIVKGSSKDGIDYDQSTLSLTMTKSW